MWYIIFFFQVAAEVAAPFAQTNKIVMIAGENGEIGASKITGEVMDIVAKLPKSIEALTGVDISQVGKREIVPMWQFENASFVYRLLKLPPT